MKNFIMIRSINEDNNHSNSEVYVMFSLINKVYNRFFHIIRIVLMTFMNGLFFK